MVRAAPGSVELRSVLETIEAVRLDQCGAPLGVLPRIRELAKLDVAIFARLLERTTGWAVEGFESDGLRNATVFRRRITDFLASRSAPAPWLHLGNPESVQTNVAVCLADGISRQDYECSDLYQRVLEPLDLRDHHVVRIILCDDGVVRGWFGGFSKAPIGREQCAVLDTLVPPLLTRMRIERMLVAAPRIHAALEATMEQIGAPAFIIDGRAQLHEMNRAARELLTARRAEVVSSLTALLSKRQPLLPFTLTPVKSEPGNPRHLAVLRPRSAEERVRLLVVMAIYRWSLTPRQGEVLQRLVKGEPNATIAAQLAISDRATELHVSAILDRAKVSNRAQLIAAVLLG
jgi:DNA-binding NarL/FixJ family response regulator